MWGEVHGGRNQIPARRGADSEVLVQHHGGLAVAASAAAAPGHAQTARPGGSGAAFPDGADHPGGVGRSRNRNSRSGARDLQAMAAESALSRPQSGEGSRYPREDLL